MAFLIHSIADAERAIILRMKWLDALADRYSSYAPLFLRLGLALVFLLFAYHKLNPATFGQGASEIRFLYDLGIGSSSALNYYVGLLELALGIFLLTGWHARLAGLVASGMIVFIWISYVRAQGLGVQPDLYRDLGLAGAGFALFLLGNGKKKTEPAPAATPSQ